MHVVDTLLWYVHVNFASSTCEFSYLDDVLWLHKWQKMQWEYINLANTEKTQIPSFFVLRQHENKNRIHNKSIVKSCFNNNSCPWQNNTCDRNDYGIDIVAHGTFVDSNPNYVVIKSDERNGSNNNATLLSSKMTKLIVFLLLICFFHAWPF